MQLVPHFVPCVRHAAKQRQRVAEQSIPGVVAALVRAIAASRASDRVAVRDDEHAADGEEDGDKIEDPEERGSLEVGGSGKVVQREEVGPLCAERERPRRASAAMSWTARHTKAKTLYMAVMSMFREQR